MATMTSIIRAILIHLLVLAPMVIHGVRVFSPDLPISVAPPKPPRAPAAEDMTVDTCTSMCTLAGVGCLAACPSQGLNGPMCFSRCIQDGLSCVQPCRPMGNGDIEPMYSDQVDPNYGQTDKP